jgi:hypothetical protein
MVIFRFSFVSLVISLLCFDNFFIFYFFPEILVVVAHCDILSLAS